MNYRGSGDNLGIFATAEMAAAAAAASSYHHHQQQQNGSGVMGKKLGDVPSYHSHSTTAPPQHHLQNMKLSPDKVELMLKKSYTNSQQQQQQQHYHSVLNAIRRGSISAAAPPFLFPSDGNLSFHEDDGGITGGSRYQHLEDSGEQQGTGGGGAAIVCRGEEVDEDEESQDIDLMDHEGEVDEEEELGDEETESGTKIDVESDSDGPVGPAAPFELQRHSLISFEHHPHLVQRPDEESGRISKDLSRISASVEGCPPINVHSTAGTQRSEGGRVVRQEAVAVEKDYEEATTTDLDFDVFTKKRKFSSVKGFSIENIIGHKSS